MNKKYFDFVKEYWPLIILGLYVLRLLFDENKHTIYIDCLFYDNYIFYNSYLAVKNSLVLHETFSSPFGILFHYFYYFIINLTVSLKLPINYFFSIASIFLAIFLLLIHGIISLIQPKNFTKIPILSIAVALALIFDISIYDQVFDHSSCYTGIYNLQMYGLGFYLFSYNLNYIINCTKLESNKINSILTGVVNAIFLFIAFFYKINFFVTFSLITLITAIINKDIRILASCSLFLSLLFVILILLTNYNINGYFLDLKEAFIAKQENNKFGLKKLLFEYSLILLKLVTIFLILKSINFFSVKNIKFYSIHVSLRQIKKIYPFLLSNINILIYFLIAILAFYLSIISDNQRPTIFLSMLLLITLIIINPNHKIPQILLSIIFTLKVLLYFINIDSRSVNLQMDDMSEIMIDDDKNKLIFKFSSTLSKKEYKKYDYLKAFEGDNYQDFSNKILQLTINEIEKNLKEISFDKQNDKMFYNSFINFFPLNGYRFLEKNIHWIHLGTTMSKANYAKIIDNYSNADVIIISKVSHPNIFKKYLNCTFFDYNLKNNLNYQLWKDDDLNLYFASKKYIKRNGNLKINTDFVYKTDKIKSSCLLK